MILIVCINDILLTWSDVVGTVKAKEYMKTQSVTKDIGRSRYFLAIKIVHSKHGVYFSFNENILWIYYKRLNTRLHASAYFYGY